jgi:hypothetical protein
MAEALQYAVLKSDGEFFEMITFNEAYCLYEWVSILSQNMFVQK